MAEPLRNRAVIVAASAGIGIFLLGLFAATNRLPEWRARKIPPAAEFSGRFKAPRKQLGMLTAWAPRLELKSSNVVDEQSELDRRDSAYRELGPRAADWRAEQGRSPFVQVSAPGQWQREPVEFRVIL